MACDGSDAMRRIIPAIAGRPICSDLIETSMTAFRTELFHFIPNFPLIFDILEKLN
jgi:hypothetical protein